MPSIDNSLYLDFYHGTTQDEHAMIRANAIFVYSKLIQGGMSIKDAKDAVELLYQDGRNQGYQDGTSDALANALD